MQEFSFKISGGRNGLVPNPLHEVGAPYASRLRNMRPAELSPSNFTAVNPEWFTCPFDFTLDWPFPQVVRGENVTLLLKRTAAATLDAAWAETAISPKQSTSPNSAATITGGGVWHSATFEETWFATNGATFLFKTAASTSVFRAMGLAVATLCASNDRLLLFGLEGDWFSGSRWLGLMELQRKSRPQFSHDQMTWSKRWAVWGEPRGGSNDVPFWTMLVMLGVFGNDAFDTLQGEFRARIERGEFGMAPLRQQGTPLACGALGNDIVAYSAEGRTVLRPQGAAYDVVVDDSPGVVNRGGLCVGAGEHAWMTPSRKLHAQALGGPVRDLGHAHRFTGSLTNLVCAYDKEEKEHWFSTENWAYVLTRWGLGGPMDIRPTSLCRADGALIGPGSGIDAETVEVSNYSHLLNMGYNGNKVVKVVEVEQHGLSDVYVDVEASDTNGTPYSLGAEQVNEVNVGFPIRSGNEFMIGVKATAPLGGSYAIPNFLVRYQADDRSARRGATGAAQDG